MKFNKIYVVLYILKYFQMLCKLAKFNIGCHSFSGVSGLTPYAPSPATVASYSPSSSPTRTQSAQGSPTNSHKPWRPRARSADESTRKIVSNILGLFIIFIIFIYFGIMQFFKQNFKLQYITIILNFQS